MDAAQEEVNSSHYPYTIPNFKLSREVSMLLTLSCTQVFILGCLSQGIFPGRVISQQFAIGSSSESSWGPAAYGLTSGAINLT
jgi:hypothetical protein